jgi:hypothetical protein
MESLLGTVVEMEVSLDRPMTTLSNLIPMRYQMRYQVTRLQGEK